MDMRASERIEALLTSELPAAQGWVVTAASWDEALDSPYRAELDLHHEDAAAEAMPLLGSSIELTCRRRGVEECLAGIVSSVREGTTSDGAHAVLVVEPALSATRHRRDTRIFQHLSVPQILEQVLDADLSVFGRRVSNELERAYPVREYTVQYGESDFDFVHRLMEEEGIVYFFRHEGGPERMVLVDRNAQHPAIESETGATLRFSERWADGVDTMEAVRAFEPVGRVTGTKVSIRTFDWTHPSMPVTAASEGSGAGPELESYVVRGTVTMGAFGETGYTAHDAGDQSQILGELQTRDRYLAEALSTSLAIRAGHRVHLSELPRFDHDREYLVVRARHRLNAPDGADDVPANVEHFSRFTVIAIDAQWRPDRVRDRPRLHGVQTATVVGPPGEEIHTDPHGRVKVQFHWDRLGQRDDKSSCWIRVMQSMGGPGWGFTFVPRIGQEVVVTFVDGDPDQPLITGAVFNGDNPIPLDYPANKTRMTIKSSSSPGGEGFNELRFEDLAGGEEIWLHGERDWNTLIKHDLTRRVGNDESQDVTKNRTRVVGQDESITIGNNQTRVVQVDESETVGHDRTRLVKNNESVTIGTNRTKQIGANEIVQIGAAASESIGGSLTQTVGANALQKVELNKVEMVGAMMTTNVGASKTTNVVLNSTVKVGGEASMTTGKGWLQKIGGNLTSRVKNELSAIIGGNRTATVALNDTLTVGVNQTVTVGINQTTTVTATSKLTAKIIELIGGDKLQVTVGSASLTMEKSGKILLKGVDLTLESGAGKIHIDGGGIIKINGPMVKINT